MPTSTTTTTTTTTAGAGVRSPSVLRQSISHILTSLPSFFLISLLLLLFHSLLLSGSRRLSSLPQTNPLLSRLSSPSPKSPPFLHLPPAAALPFPENFFSSNSLTLNPPPPNSSLHISLTAVKARVSNPPNQILFSLLDSNKSSSSSQQEFSLAKDGLQLLHLLSLLFNAHSAALLAFLLCYATAFGVVFHCVASNVLSRPAAGLVWSFWRGARLGVRRIVGFLIFRWAVRDAVVQILWIFFFDHVEDPVGLFRLFVKVKVMPFSFSVLEGDEGAEMFGFLVVWGALDFAVSVFLVFVPWVHVVDGVERAGKEVVREGFFLVLLVNARCVLMKCAEVVLSGGLGRMFFAAVCGRRFAMWVQAVLEVYFMVVSLVLYLEARRRDFELGGRRFEREELERCIDRL